MSAHTLSTQEKLRALLAKSREAKIKLAGVIPEANPSILETVVTINPAGNVSSTNTYTLASNVSSLGVDRNGNTITYNEEQLRAIELGGSGKDCIIVGAAGTGKTTCSRAVLTTLIQNNHAGVLHCEGHKYLTSGTPGIVVTSFTRRAVANIRKNLDVTMQRNCITLHSLLEYEPVYYDAIDPETGKEVKSMKFEPTRNEFRPLPSTIRCIVIEEASMVSLELFKQLTDALSHSVQFIFLGDIQQLPPVFGSAILGFKMLELPVVELTQVYRQALESPIIRLAHRILSGNPIPIKEYENWKVPNKLTLHPWKKEICAEDAALTISKFLTVAIDAGAYDPDEDMVLIPFNKGCGTNEVNKRIANHIAKKNNKVVWEIIAGFNKYYLSVLDRVLVDKEDGVIVKIEINPEYTGARAQPESVNLDYWGYTDGSAHEDTTASEEDIDFLLDQAVALAGADQAERVRQASHIITVQMQDPVREVRITTAGSFAGLILSYALTVHKSQGSEWRKVFLMLHKSHNTMLQRELLYTAVTRAKEELYVICEKDTFTKGILTQRIKGNSLAEKAEFFKGKVDSKQYLIS